MLVDIGEDHIVVFGFRCFFVDDVPEVLHALVGIFTCRGTKPKGMVADTVCIHCHLWREVMNDLFTVLQKRRRKAVNNSKSTRLKGV
jgi:hypothetical protein